MQRLSSSGYVFSASLPPYLASAAITAIDVLEENPALITKLKKNIGIIWKGWFWNHFLCINNFRNWNLSIFYTTYSKRHINPRTADSKKRVSFGIGSRIVCLLFLTWGFKNHFCKWSGIIWTLIVHFLVGLWFLCVYVYMQMVYSQCTLYFTTSFTYISHLCAYAWDLDGWGTKIWCWYFDSFLVVPCVLQHFQPVSHLFSAPWCYALCAFYDWEVIWVGSPLISIDGNFLLFDHLPSVLLTILLVTLTGS